MGLLQNNDVQRSFAAKHIDADVPFVVSCKQKIGAPVCYLQSAARHLLQETREDRLRERQSSLRSRNAQAQASFEQKKHSRRRPRLWSTSYRIQCRCFTGASRETAKQFGEAVQIKEQTRVEQTGEDRRCRFFQ